MLQDKSLRTQVLKEIIDIPENKLREVYHFLHATRKPSKKKIKEKQNSFAGIWKDLSDEVFISFISEIANRRKMAFSGRPVK